MKKGNLTMLKIPNNYSSVGVRTRSRTLDLQPNSDLSFLQLRSRRLHKPLFQHSSPPLGSTDASNDNLGCHVTSSGFPESRTSKSNDKQERFCHFDSRESTREILIRDERVIRTPNSITQPTCSFAVNPGDHTMQTAIPRTLEMEEFFAAFELHQQQLFLQRYNYDIVNDMPQPGRYEWVRVDN